MKESFSRYYSCIPFIFFLSGLTGLVYEISWARILSTIIGNTSLAVSVVVSLFMTGLAVGSFLAASLPLQIRPLWIYAALELLIGLYSAATPGMTRWAESIYHGIYPAVAGNFLASVGAKAFVAALFLLIPTTAMGATLPVLIRSYHEEQRRYRAGMLYGLNTAGAVAGTLLAGYGLLPYIGISKTITFAAATNLLLAAGAFIIGRYMPGARSAPARERAAYHPIYWLFFLTGFAALAYEILWTRALLMFFGSSVYAFSAILAAFLLGIATGSTYYARRIKPDADPYQFFSLLQFRLALAAIFFVGIFMGIPFLLIWLFQVFHHSFALFQTAQFLLIGCTIFYATFLSGACFPAMLHFFRHRTENMDSIAGFLYTYNTIGSILGSLCAGFVLIPVLGVERSIRIIVLINLILGLFCFRKTHRSAQDKRVLAIGGVSLALLIFLPPWNQSIYNAGFYAFAYKYVQPAARETSDGFRNAVKMPSLHFADLFPSFQPASDLDLIYYAEGLTATVAVTQDAKTGVRSLLINGKPDASNVPTGDMRTQLLLGHLPALLTKQLNDALVIGLGSGVTAGAISTHNPKRIDCIEIEPKVAEAARFYEPENLGILRKPNVRLIYDDGRNFVQHSRSKYDVITSEPSNLWMSGVANLFTREFFQVARQRLKPEGILCQWIHLYQISRTDILIFMKTFQSVFPHLSIWIDGSDMLLLGSATPFSWDTRLVQERMKMPDVAKSLARSNLTAENIGKRYLGDERIVKILRASLPVNTDDHPVLEFSAPRSVFWDHSRQIVAALRKMKEIAEANL